MDSADPPSRAALLPVLGTLGGDAASHLVPGDSALLHAEGQFVLHDVSDRLGLRLLEDHAGDGGHGARRCARGVAPGDDKLAAKTATVKLGHKAVEEPQEGRFAAGRGPRDEDEGAPFDVERDIGEGVRGRAGIAIGDVVEAGDHGASPAAGKAPGWGEAATGWAIAAAGSLAGCRVDRKRRRVGHAQASATAAPAGENSGQPSPAKGL